MKACVIVLIALFCGNTFGDELRLSPRFRTVYILPMTNALDQHIASHVTSGRVLWVVLDPAGADAVLTDNVDETFWNWLARSYPNGAGTSSNNRGAAYRDYGIPRQRGTIFLVDPRRRLVLWSIYELPKNSSPGQLDHSAERIATQLKAAFAKK